MSGPASVLPYDLFAIGDLSQYALRSNLPAISVKEAPYYAKGNGIDDDTNSLQNAIYDGIAQGRAVYVPGTLSSYLITSSLLIGTTAGTSAGASGFRLFGDGQKSVIAPNGAFDAIKIGAGQANPACSDVWIHGIGVQGVASSLFGIKAANATNIAIEKCSIASPGGGISLDYSYCARVRDNTIGSLTGTAIGISVFNASAAVSLIANRIDGTVGQTGTTGILASAPDIFMAANTTETVGVGVDITGNAIEIHSPYCESNYTADIRATTAAGTGNGILITGGQFSLPMAGMAASIDITYTTSCTFGPNTFKGTAYTSGAPIRINAGATGVKFCGRQSIVKNDGNPVGGAHATNVLGAVLAGASRVDSATKELTGNLTGTTNIFKVCARGGAATRVTVKYLLQADTTESGGGKNLTYGTKSRIVTMGSDGAWTADTGWVDDTTERTQGTASVLTLTLVNSDNTGSFIAAACTNYNGANANAVFWIDVETASVTPEVDPV